jgi:tetratricopeptide (TPR) repeat protein
LVQAAVRDWLPEGERRRWAGIAVGLVAAAFPGEPDDPRQRGACRRFLPHARATLVHARAAALPPGEPAERLLRHAAHYQHIFGFDASAREMLEQALRMAEALHGPAHAHVAMVLNDLGLVLMNVGDAAGAQRYARRALEIDEANLGRDSPIVATDLVNLAAILKKGNAFDEARRLTERALRIDRALGPEYLAAVSRDENNLGTILRELADMEGARRCFERAIAIDEERGAADLPRHLNNLGLLLREMGALSDAEKLAARALAIGEDRYGKDDPEIATFCSNLATVLQEIGLRAPRPEERHNLLHEAKKHLERALAIGVNTYGRDDYVVAIRRNNLGLLLKDLGDTAGAHAELDKAVAIARKVLGADHPRVRKLENNRAIALGHRKPTPPPR